MAFTVQDDSGDVANANAYIDAAWFKSYHTDRGNDIAGKATGDIEKAIVRATDYLDQRYRFVGERLNGRSQTTEWPRRDAYDADRNYVVGIPDEVREATAEYALRALDDEINPDPTRDDTERAIKSKTETVGPITEKVEYVDGSTTPELPKYPAADKRLVRTGLVRTGGTVMRA